MARITVLGGTGYAGAAVVAEAARRGHEVRAASRRAPEADQRVAGVAYLTGSATDPVFLESVVAENDVVVSALSPRGPMLGQVRVVDAELISWADRLGFRLGAILGAGSLLTEPGGPRLADLPSFPDAAKGEALEMAEVLADLQASPVGVDWFAVSPASGFGAFAPGATLGHYRVGGDVVLTDESGNSHISAGDLALAILDEVERPAHRRQRFTVAY
ncbi:MAG: NAD(P)H-binding protein [Bifidobacteriaceae bacterium]|jgi:putative NADH-flavin reductase|nr:NAD(P)H-binding protein [Bifidobacteriaceae bacterium]